MNLFADNERFPVRRSYAIEPIKQTLALHLSVSFEPTAPATAVVEPTAPDCPKCQESMVLRTAQRGKNAGNQFWGCPNYPQCCSVLQYEPMGRE